MNGPDNYREAERLAAAYKQAIARVGDMPRFTPEQASDLAVAVATARALLAKAQVHATLAHAAATALPFASIDTPEGEAEWHTQTAAWAEVLR